LVLNVVQVCIFAYGQTGSGKTHTMLGDPDDFDQMGVIPRSLEQIFKSSEALSLQGWTFQMQVSYMALP
jgi:kinesin family protein C1